MQTQMQLRSTLGDRFLNWRRRLRRRCRDALRNRRRGLRRSASSLSDVWRRYRRALAAAGFDAAAGGKLQIRQFLNGLVASSFSFSPSSLQLLGQVERRFRERQLVARSRNSTAAGAAATIFVRRRRCERAPTSIWHAASIVAVALRATGDARSLRASLTTSRLQLRLPAVAATDECARLRRGTAIPAASPATANPPAPRRRPRARSDIGEAMRRRLRR